MAVPGKWNIFGINLPDYGKTEAKTTWQANPLAVQAYGAPSSYAPSSNGMQSIPGGTLSTLGPNTVKTPGANIYSSGNTLGASTTGGGVSGTAQVPQNNGGNQGGGDPFAGQGDAAKSQAQIELEQTLGEYDRYAEEARAQSANLDTQKVNADTGLENTLSRAKREGVAAKGEATMATASAKNKALGTAQDVQRSNRNVLRALGILSSSAAGEMLNKPMNEFGSQAADLEQGLVKRLGVVEDWLMSKQDEFTAAKNDMQQKYMELKGNIDRDLRFNDRQRVTAVKAAGAALQQRLADIQTQSVNYQTAAKQYSDNMLLQLAQMKMYQNPSADVSSIYNTLLSGANQGRQTQQVGVQQTEEQRRKLLSGPAMI